MYFNCAWLFYVLFFVVCDKCVFDKTKKGNRNLYFYGFVKSKNRKTVFDRNYDDGPVCMDTGHIIRNHHNTAVSDDTSENFRYCD